MKNQAPITLATVRVIVSECTLNVCFWEAKAYHLCWFWFNTPQQLHMQKYNKNWTMVDNKPQLAQYLSSGLALNILELQLDFQQARHQLFIHSLC